MVPPPLTYEQADDVLVAGVEAQVHGPDALEDGRHRALLSDGLSGPYRQTERQTHTMCQGRRLALRVSLV